MSKFKAYTLIELLVVMGIIAMMTGLSIYGLVRFQATTRIQTSFNDTLSVLKTVQNDARNAISFNYPQQSSICTSNNNCVADYLGIKFKNVGGSASYSVYGCVKNGALVVCSNANEVPFQTLPLTDVTYSYTGEQCDYILFQKLSGDILDLNSLSSTLTNNTVCNLRLTNSYGDSKSIEINLLNNSIKDAGI